jgi:peptidoglycan/xylan/chitin deacetylase (PgdA/CDA1 family)
MKSLLKSVRDQAVAVCNAHKWMYASGSLLVLTYHRVLPRTFGELSIVEPGMFVFEDTFESHLEWLNREFAIIGLADWIKRARAGDDLPKRACAITFDDGWHDNYEFAFPLLKRFSTPATVFVVAGMAGTSRQFWPERLARLIRASDNSSPYLGDRAGRWLTDLVSHAGANLGTASPEQISAVIQEAKRWTDEELHHYIDSIEESGYSPTCNGADILNWRQLSEMLESGLVSIGSHTLDHKRLGTELDVDEIDRQVSGSHSVLEQNTGTAPELFCYPNGDVSKQAADRVRAKYLGACTTANGWNESDCDPYAIRRITLHEGNSGTTRAFKARISGLV